MWYEKRNTFQIEILTPDGLGASEVSTNPPKNGGYSAEKDEDNQGWPGDFL